MPSSTRVAIGRNLLLPGIVAVAVAIFGLIQAKAQDANNSGDSSGARLSQTNIAEVEQLRCPSLAALPPDVPQNVEQAPVQEIPQLTVPPIEAESAMLPGLQCPLPAKPDNTVQQTTVQHVIVPVYLRRPVNSRFHGLLGKIFGPILAPVTNGLDDTAWGLNGTAASLQMLQQPMERLASPLGGLSQPLTGLAQPITELAQPINSLAQPIAKLSQPIHELSAPVEDLSRSASSLSRPMTTLGSDLSGLKKPLTGMQAPLAGLPAPLNGVAQGLVGLQGPLTGLQQPITHLATPIRGLQNEMHSLRVQLISLENAIVDIGRNVTLAIVFGSAIIAYAIWTHRKVPAAVEPTVTTMETHPNHAPDGTDHHTTIIKTHPASKAGPQAAGEHHTPPQPGTPGHPPDDHNPPPPNVIQPPGE